MHVFDLILAMRDGVDGVGSAMGEGLGGMGKLRRWMLLWVDGEVPKPRGWITSSREDESILPIDVAFGLGEVVICSPLEQLCPRL